MMPKRIRGRYRRRVVDWLADGGGTVSQAAKAVGLRLPHASKEMKKLRLDGYVTSDLTVGHKGALQRLTATGRSYLENDEIARLIQFTSNGIPEDAIGCLLARDGQNLLFAYTKILESSMLAVPTQSIVLDSSSPNNSSGNEGVGVNSCWITLRESQIRWYSLSTLERTGGPNRGELQFGISEWENSLEAVGIFRAKLLDMNNDFDLSVGDWFKEVKSDEFPSLPASLSSESGWSLGKPHPDSKPLRPNSPLVAQIDGRLVHGILLNSAFTDSFMICDSKLLGQSSVNIPISVLPYWIKRAHPRLSETELEKRLNFILGELGFKTRLRKKARTNRQQSTWQRFGRDWGNKKWTDSFEINEKSIIDTTNLNATSIMSLVEWFGDLIKNKPLVIQIPKGIILNANEQKQISSIDSLRLVITDRWSGPKPQLLLVNDESQNPLSVSLILDSDIILSIEIEQPSPMSELMLPEGWTIPNSIIELLNMSNDRDSTMILNKLELDNNWKINPLELDPDLIYYISCLLFPEGNETWANSIESRHPLFSWISSPNNSRWNRWQRIGESIPLDWLELLSPEFVPTESLPRISINSGNSRENPYVIEFSKRLQDNPDIALKFRNKIDTSSSAESSWIISLLLTQLNWLPPSFREDLASNAISKLVENPPLNFIGALESLMQLQNQSKLPDDWHLVFMERATSLDENHELRIWSELVNWITRKRKPSLEIMRNITAALPSRWWAPLAEQILITHLELNETRDWLENLDVCWTALILRPPGELHYCPGVSNYSHPGCSINLIEKLEFSTQILSIEGENLGLLHIKDLFDTLFCVMNNSPPKPGRAHRYLGWLGQPLSSWPVIDESELLGGNRYAASRLSSKLSGFHHDLMSSSQRKLF